MKRLRHLDAVRGLAALAVMLHHAWLSLPAVVAGRDAFAIPLLDMIVLGRPAVVLFFVLSGYVLTLYLQTARFAPAAFALRRLVRILLPYWATLCVAYLLYLTAPRHASTGMSPWIETQWLTNISPSSFARQLLLLAGPRQFPLDHVAWSLVHELRLSLIMPFMVLLTRRSGVATMLAVAFATTLTAEVVVAHLERPIPSGVHGFLFDDEGLGRSLALTARFTLAFALGSAAATCGPAICGIYERWRPLRLAVSVVALLLLSQRQEGAMTVGAVLIISAAASSRTLERILALPACVWLGRVSYSLYLVHLPIMLTCAAWFAGALRPAPILLLAMAISFLAADLLFRLVERPSILLSRTAGNMTWPRWTTSPRAYALYIRAINGGARDRSTALCRRDPPRP